MMRVAVRIGIDQVIDVEVQNCGPVGDEYADGDHPGGPGVRQYEWTAWVRANRDPVARRPNSSRLQGRVLHARADGAAHLTARVMAAVAQAAEGVG